MVSRKAYETELGEMTQGKLFERCKDLKLKNCRKNMTKITLQNKILAGEPWKHAKKTSAKKPAKESAKKPAKEPAAKSSGKKPSSKKPSGRKCKEKVCDPGTICDISSPKGACRKRTIKTKRPYGEKKLEAT